MKELVELFKMELDKLSEIRRNAKLEGSVSDISSETDLNGFVEQFMAKHNVREEDLKSDLEFTRSEEGDIFIVSFKREIE